MSGLLSIVSSIPFLLFIRSYILVLTLLFTFSFVLTAFSFDIDLCLFSFQDVPWAAAVTDKVKDMQGLVAKADQMQTKKVKMEKELGRRGKELEVVSG